MTIDWEPVKADIHDLYHVQNKTLDDVMRIIRGRHGFSASERSYRSKLQEWGLRRYRAESNPAASLGMRPFGRRRSTATSTVPSLSRRVSSTSNSSGSIGYDSTNSTPSAINAKPEFSFNFPDPSSDIYTGEDDKTELHNAIINQDSQKVQCLLDRGAPVDTKDTAENEPLHNAVGKGSEIIVHHLIKFGADVNVRGHLGQCPLHAAVSNSANLAILLEAGAKPFLQDHHENTPLHTALLPAIANSDPASIASSIEVLMRSACDFNIPNHSGATPFHLLVGHQHTHTSQFSSCLEHFLSHGADIALELPNGTTPLQAYLANIGRIQATASFLHEEPRASEIQLFIEKGANPETLLPCGTPLVPGYFKYLPGCHSNATFALSEALCRVARLSPIPGSVTTAGNSVLHDLLEHPILSKRSPVRNCVQILLQRGADPNKLNSKGATPLQLLVFKTESHSSAILGIVACMLHHHANPWLRDSSGNSAISVAATSKKTGKLLALLLQSDLEYLEASSESGENEADSQWRDRWSVWEQAALVASWDEALGTIEGSVSSLKMSCAGALTRAILRTLAEKHLRKADQMFKGELEERSKRRRHLARILSDCWDRNIDVDVQHFHELILHSR
ncbi:hypothetical protein CCHR01_08929 [Colletotrichum chrysophilum]|uniref:Clr5 domain-containing protein n=1 Tax=Colletotrichum chrysophilum TaxID=1836956 RepID=A0AAD9AKN7_9PEZI|nr:hypothetical protein CCHR01_08929 [Colletotrichum chrysophilum]